MKRISEILALAIFLVLSIVSEARGDADVYLEQVRRHHYLAKEFEGQNVAAVRLADGTITQRLNWAAYYEGFTNPGLAPTLAQLGGDRSSYAQTISTCLLANALATWFGTPAELNDYKIQLSAFIRYYVSLLEPVQIPPDSIYPIVAGVRQYNCNTTASFGVMRLSALAYFAYKVKFELSDYPNLVRDALDVVHCGNFRVPTYQELALVYFLTSPLGYVVKSHMYPTYGLNPGTHTPEAIFRCKTTPWLASTQITDNLGRKPTWNELGMNYYYAWGLTPVHTWIAQQHYYNTTWGTIMDWTPILGSAWAAADASQDWYEGRNVHGRPVNRYYSASMFALNYAFAVADVDGLAVLGSAAMAELKTIRALAKAAPDAATAMSLLERTKRVLRGAGGLLGDNVAKFRGLFGTPLLSENGWLAFKSGWRATSDEASKMFGGSMLTFLRGGPTRDGIIVPGIQVIMKDFMKNGGSAHNMYMTVRQKLKEAVAFSTDRATQPSSVPDAQIFAELATTKYGKDASLNEMRQWPASLLSGENLDDIKAFVTGPGHVVEANANGVTYYIRNGEAIIDGENFVVKQFCIDTATMKKGSIEYIASYEARDAMEREVERLFTESMNGSTKVERVMEIGIRIEWLINQVLPYSKGNSSIAQAWKHAIFDSRGIALGEIRSGIGFDIKAWVRTAEQYVAEHPSYYKRVAETLDGVTFPAPTLPPTPPAISPPTSITLKGKLDIKSAVKEIGLSGGLRQFSGWIGNKYRTSEWDSQAADPPDQSNLPNELRNPLFVQIKAFPMASNGEPVVGSVSIAEGRLTTAPADFDATKYPDWHRPGLNIDIPDSFSNEDVSTSNDFGIWAHWAGTKKKRRIYPADVLIYEESGEETPASIQSEYTQLKKYLEDKGISVDLRHATTGLNLSYYRVAFLSLFGWRDLPGPTWKATSDLTSWVAKLPAWLGKGGRRLVVMGENSEYWNVDGTPGINDNINSLVSGIGSALRLSSASADDLDYGDRCKGFGSMATSPLTTDITTLVEQWTATVTGGESIGMASENGSGAWMQREVWSAERTSDVILSGDTNWVLNNNSDCGFVDENKDFIFKLVDSMIP